MALPTPRVAIVIPCFRDGALLREAVASIREAEPIERVIVNDGSDDTETLVALDECAAAGWKVVHQGNRGPAAALQRGIDESTAPLVFRLDADDLLEPGALRVLADALESHPEAGFAYGDFAFFGLQEGVWRAPPFDPWTVLYGNFWSPSVCVRRSVLEAIGGLVPGWRYEDWNLYMRFADHGVSGVHAGCITYRRRLQAGRRQEKQNACHREIYRQMRVEHAALFARRRESLQAVRPPMWQRIAYPLFLGARYALPPPMHRAALYIKLRRGARRAS
ncbi:MAG: hypothetical protein RL190_1341 [Actinomycetota bacterium]|jgi:glycosyltransferase involved in cell wall biosynthesis